MTPADFILQPRGPYQFNCWRAKQRVATPFGEFVVEATTPLKDTAPPDARMLREASELAEFTRAHPDAILARIFEHYQSVSDDADWMETCEVPVSLAAHQLAPYLEDLSLSVDRDGSEPTIYMSPQWDEEHGLYLAVREGKVEFREL